jgi:hypothetical protein
MSSQYVRPASQAPLAGWRLVTVPAFSNTEPAVTYLITNELATELEHLIQRGRIREARTLLFWFDDSDRSGGAS